MKSLLRKPLYALSGVFFLSALVLTSCATGTPPIHSLEPFGIIGEGADIYVFVPVKGNEFLLNTLCGTAIPQSTLNQYTARTNAVFAGLFLTKEPVMRLCSYGSYPWFFADSLFPQKDGWEKRPAEGANTVPYYHSAQVDVALPASALACISLGNDPRSTEAFLQRITKPQKPEFPERFQSFIEKETELNSIGIYIRSGALLSNMFKQNYEVNLPLSSIELYVTPKDDEHYAYQAVITAAHARIARLLSVFAGSVFHADITVQDSQLLLNNGIFTTQELRALLQPLQMAAPQ